MARAIGPEFYQDMSGRALPKPLADLVDDDDPALDFIRRGILNAVGEGFDVEDPIELALIVKAARRKFERSERVPYDRAERLAVARAVAESEAAALEARSVVYYMRIGDRVKIGTTTNLPSRIKDFRPEEVMATEPGGVEVERKRHAQFCHFRLTGEWFRLAGSLREHIAALRAAADGRRQAG